MKPEYRHKQLEKDPLSVRLEQFDYNILACGIWQQAQTATLQNDMLSSFKLVGIAAGEAKLQVGADLRSVSVGDAVLFAPFVRYSVHCVSAEPVRLYFVYFDLLPLQKRADFVSLFHCSTIGIYPKLMEPSIFPLLTQTVQRVETGEPGCYFSAKLLLERVLMHILRMDASAAPAPGSGTAAEETVVQCCIDYLSAHMAEGVRVEELCAAAGVSQSYLHKCFSKTMGCSTKKFVLTYKFSQMERELKCGILPIGTLAERYGFSSAYAFSAAFKKYYGTSPTAYRKSKNQKEPPEDL
ncbi:MAG: AraC family transcriptional regulator [Pseudoflavonifractor sp.]